jgi:MFS family permease
MLHRLRHHSLILPLYLPSLFIAVAWGIRDPILPLYVRDFGAAYGLVGIVLAGEAIGMLASDLPGGMLLRWLGQKRAMIAGLTLTTLAILALVWAQSVPEVLVYRILGGVGFALFATARHAYLAEQIPILQRGRAVALLGGVFRIGSFMGPVLVGFVADKFSLRAPILLMAILAGLAWVVVVLFMPDQNEHQPLKPQAFGLYLREMRVVARQQAKILMTVGAGQLFAQMVRTGPKVLIPLFAADVLGLNVTQIGLIVSIGAAIDMSLFYPVGVVMDRYGRKFAIVPSFIFLGIGMILMPLTQGFVGLAIVAGVIGFGNGLGSGTMMTLAADLAPSEARGEFLGMWRLIGDAGFTVGPIVAGAVAGWLALPIAMVVMGSSGLLSSFIFATLVPETNKRQTAV